MNKKNLEQVQIEKIEQEKQQEIERRLILMKANEIKEETFSFDLNNEIILKKEIADLTLESIDNPEEKYELYYKVINKLLRKYLPKGDQFKKARNIIYEEKNTFLTRGHRKDKTGIRGADSRMSYITELDQFINIITDWISTKGTLFDLYTKLRELNISKGYGSGN